MTDATELDLDAIRARLDAATEGPWEWKPDSCSGDGLTYTPSRVWTHGGVDYFGEALDDYVLASHLGNADAEFIAHARTDVERLLAALEAAESSLAAVTRLRDQWRENAGEDRDIESRVLRTVADHLDAALAPTPPDENPATTERTADE